MAVVKNKNTEENREFWSHVERVSEAIDRALPRDPQNKTENQQRFACENGTQGNQ